MGRPSKLTTERQEAILGFIRAGVPNVHAAQLSGISETTFYEWLSKAQGKTEKNDARFPEFLESLKEAEAGFIESNLGVIRRAATESSVTKREHIRGTTPKGPRKSSKSGRGVVCGPARSPSICDGWNSRDGTDSKTTATPQQNHITQELTPATIRQRTRRNNGRTNDNFGVIR